MLPVYVARFEYLVFDRRMVNGCDSAAAGMEMLRALGREAHVLRIAESVGRLAV
jgi:hypothetical protein